jgi:AmmeMemoRadiSam system protein A
MDAGLDVGQRRRLLELARQAVGHAAHREALPALTLQSEAEVLRRPGCAFVTLTESGLLRGCIGGLEPRLPLAEDVWEHAYAAACDDFRFEPVQPSELDDIEVEVSVLTPPREVAYRGAEDLERKLRPGVDGVILSAGIRRATFLPQVWEKIPDTVEFLDRLSEKAGLPAAAWRRGEVSVQVYQVVSFHDSEPPRGG